MSVEFPQFRSAEDRRTHSIEVSHATFQRLKEFLAPLGNDADRFIARLLDAYDARQTGISGSRPISQESSGIVFDAVAPPDLTHAMVLSAKVNDITLPKGTNWIVIYRATLRSCDQKGTLAPAVSFGSRNANFAWKSTVELAQSHSISLNVEFVWGLRAPVSVRGERGRLAAWFPAAGCSSIASFRV